MPSPVEEKSTSLRVTFLGVSTLLFEASGTAILTDGFFSRPGKPVPLLRKVAPDQDAIARYLDRAGVKELEAVIVLHSHLDHALDAPEVVLQTGARLVGSDSTRNIGLGYPLPDEKIRVIQASRAETFGPFQITMIPTRHSPVPLLKLFGVDYVFLAGEITEPLEQPARGFNYKEGGSYTLLVEHAGRTVLVQASAGFEPGALRGRPAEVVFLGIGTLGNLPQQHREGYWREVVEAVAPKRIIPIHWDDFSRPLDEPLVPLPRWLDNFDETMAFLRERAAAKNIDIKLMQAWEKIDPFAGI